jgi:hypothetical protein
MRSLGVVPGQTLELEVFEETAGGLAGLNDEVPSSRNKVETGFKGTGLYRSDGSATRRSSGRSAGAVDVAAEMEEDEAAMLQKVLRRSMEEAGSPAADLETPIVAGNRMSEARRNSASDNSDSDQIKRPSGRKRRALITDSSPERSVSGKKNGVVPMDVDGSEDELTKKGRRQSEAIEVISDEDYEAPTKTMDKVVVKPRSSLGKPARVLGKSKNDDSDSEANWDFTDDDNGPDEHPTKNRRRSSGAARKEQAAFSANYAEVIEEEADWACRACTFRNPGRFLSCEICREPRK